MIQIRSHPFFRSALIAMSLCLTLFVVLAVYNSGTLSTFSDSLWAQHIDSILNEKGYSIHNVARVTRKENRPTILVIAVNNLVNGEIQKPEELIKDVLAIILMAHADVFPQPQPVDMIFVIAESASGDLYAVNANFEDVQEFQSGKITQQAYIKRWGWHTTWLLDPDTLGNTPEVSATPTP